MLLLLNSTPYESHLIEGHKKSVSAENAMIHALKSKDLTEKEELPPLPTEDFFHNDGEWY